MRRHVSIQMILVQLKVPPGLNSCSCLSRENHLVSSPLLYFKVPALRGPYSPDEIYINCIKEAGLYDQIWQAFAVFLPIKSVGVQGDQRTHSHVVGLRAITSSDGMTADW